MCKRYANLPAVTEFKKHFVTTEREKQHFYKLPDKVMSSRALAQHFITKTDDKLRQKLFNDAYTEYFRTKVLNDFF